MESCQKKCCKDCLYLCVLTDAYCTCSGIFPHKMHSKKQPQLLEYQSLLGVGRWVRDVCQDVAEKLSEAPFQQKSVTPAAVTEAEDIIEKLRNIIFTSSAHYFHAGLSRLILSTISDIICDQASKIGCREAFLLKLSQAERKKFKRKEKIILQFSSLVCTPSVQSVFCVASLDRTLVQALCSVVPRMTWLHTLDLGPWSSHNHALLSTSSQESGAGLVHLKNLVVLSVTDASLEFIINISVFCLQLQRLSLSQSQVETCRL